LLSIRNIISPKKKHIIARGFTKLSEQLSPETASILLGSLHWLLNKVTDFPSIRKLSIGLIIIIRFMSFILILALYDAVDIMKIFDERFSLLPKKFTLQWLTSSQFLGAVLYFLFIDTIYAWFYQIRTILGKRVFRNLLLGKYRTPRAEERIFMFIDMKDSTKHAEQLGHVKFTRLIQQCFRDFGLIAEKRGVDIYQYIGDEDVALKGKRDKVDIFSVRQIGRDH
jgi:adenylate cyclase